MQSGSYGGGSGTVVQPRFDKSPTEGLIQQLIALTKRVIANEKKIELLTTKLNEGEVLLTQLQKELKGLKVATTGKRFEKPTTTRSKKSTTETETN